jgi:hypothetical protein
VGGNGRSSFVLGAEAAPWNARSAPAENSVLIYFHFPGRSDLVLIELDLATLSSVFARGFVKKLG